MSQNNELPSLPESRQCAEHGVGWFTAGQMQDYARAAIAAQATELMKANERVKNLQDEVTHLIGCGPPKRAQAVGQSEPVAWFEYNSDLDAWFLAYGYNPNAKTRPLFTHPAPLPALSDDEIDIVWEGVPNCGWKVNYEDQRKFARALEDKITAQGGTQ